jgi:hypothetical protein
MKAQSAGACVLTIATIGAAVLAAGCQQFQNPAQPSGAVHESTATLDSPESAAALASLGPDLAAVRRATARFHEVSQAFAAGYTIPENEPCVAVPGLGAMGTHAPHPGLIADQALDPARPELLLYLRKPDGGMRLIAVEYLQFVLVSPTPGATTGEPWVSPDFNNPTAWPANYHVVSPVPELFGESFGDYHAGHTPTMPWHWDLHAWIWAHNPAGMFAPFNPSIACE